MVEVQCIAENSPYLDDVKRLWRENDQWLGYFPEGAFAERARTGRLLVGLCDGVCVGYVTYYTTSSRKARITHLCVDDSFRGKRVARRLIDSLRERTKNLLGIGLYCCQAFPAWNVWPRLGFIPLHEKIGRGKNRRTLTFYWLEHSHPTLFSSTSASDDDRLDVAIDANIFYDLSDPSRPGASETQGILADWLQPSIRLCVTQELLTEISRNPDVAERNAQRAEFTQFDCPACDTDGFLAAEAKIKTLLGKPKTERDAGDQRQLARTIASQVTVFVTRDSALLDAADKIYDEYGLSVIRPVQLVGQFEELRHEGEFQRARLAGTRLQIVRVSVGYDTLVDAIQNTLAGERKRDIEKRLNLFLSHPDRFSCHSITDEAGAPLAFYVIDRHTPHCITVPMFRIANGTLHTRRAGTLASTLLGRIVHGIARQKVEMILVTENAIAPPLADALPTAGFVQGQLGWVKLALGTIDDCDQIAALLKQCSNVTSLEGERTSQIIDVLTGGVLQHDNVLASEIEHMLWPAKLRDCDIPTFIVPIRPRWARDLFDAGLADQTWFGAKEELALNPDSVYYRAVRPRVLEGTGRILWYVSGDDKIPGTKQIRACSRLDSVETGKPKEIFHRYRRFGVYEWHHVFETAGKSLDGEVMAIRFSDTELFDTPVKRATVREVLQQHNGVWNNLQCPVRIPTTAFEELYRQGIVNDNTSM